MTRNTMLVYLKNLRDLEVAKYKLRSNQKAERNRYNKEINQIQQEISDLQHGCFVYEDVFRNWFFDGFFGWILKALLILLFPWFVAFVYMRCELKMDLRFSMITSGITLVALVLLVKLSSLAIEKSKRIKYNKEEKHRLESRVPQVQLKQQSLQAKTMARSNFERCAKQEHDRVCQLLTEAYSLNILPNQYRNLASVYYIYDYMSSSQATLEETLMHEHMENGIQRIMAKLDTIIAQNEELILHARCIEANTRETADNTRRILENEQRMLASMERTEQNTADAAQAASVAAQYSEVNAFFSAARYIDSQRGR